MSLFKTLATKFPQKQVMPFGSVLVIHREKFEEAWHGQLKNEQCEVLPYSGDYFLVRQNGSESANATTQEPTLSPQIRNRRTAWTPADIQILERMRRENASMRAIAKALNRSLGSVTHKVGYLKNSSVNAPTPEPQVEPRRREREPDQVYELLKACVCLWQVRNRTAVEFILAKIREALTDAETEKA